MSTLLTIIGIIIFIATIFEVIRNLINEKRYIRKRAKVVGFESYNYLTVTKDKNNIYNPIIMPILEFEEENKKILVGINDYKKINDFQEGKEIDIIYKKGNEYTVKIYRKKYGYYYLIMIISTINILLTINSF
ncbi:hypothetical protein [Clostridium sp.]|uniref:hypothetical protein n=1 Tax=Clostridium sp. TaxID=1506 RepID=UPI00262A2DB9|nr:hypothetical protein [Clostridium sp.]